MGPVLARALRRARTLAESLDARGFSPTTPRAVRRPLHMRSEEIGGLLAFAALVLGVVSARVLYGLYVVDLYYHPTLRPLYGFVRSWL
jgi:energy-coupling factor transporter transmembrane protein EcfT